MAEDFLSHYLQPQVSVLLQPKTFRLHKDSFVDENLREYFSDLLYQVDFREGQQGFVYILFEHKSYPAPDIAFQLARYMIRIWEYASKQVVGFLPPVIPVVLYHGSVKWSIPLDFAALYRAPESLRERLLNFTYCLCDLSAYSDEEIKLGAMSTVALLLLKHIHSENLAERLADLFRLLRAMTEQTALEFLRTILQYLGAATERVTAEDCRKALKTAFSETGEMHMDRILDELVAEQRTEWIRKGMEAGISEGRQGGIQEGAASLAVRMLRRKFGGLDPALEERVRQLPLEHLERLGEELLDLPSESALTEWLDGIVKSH